MPRITLVNALIVLTLFLAGLYAERSLVFSRPSAGHQANCPFSFPSARFCARMQWESPHPSTGAAQPLVLTFYPLDANGSAAPAPQDPGAEVLVSLWMPGMGHGSPPPQVRAVAGKPGTYRLEGLVFSMPGEWEIWVSLLRADQFSDKAKITLNVD